MLGHLHDVVRLLRGKGVHLGGLTSVLATRYKDRPALETVDAVSSYAQVETTVGQLAAAHRAAGIGAGDVVLIVIDNRPEILFQAIALARAGAVAAPVNARLSPREVAAVAGASGATAVLVDPQMTGALADDGGLGDLRWIVTATHDHDGDVDVDAFDLRAWLTANPGERLGPSDADPSETVMLLATSGTTGTPKAARLTSRGLLSALGRLAVAPVGHRVGLRGGRDMAIAALPLTHVMGFSVALATLCAGVPLLHLGRFDPGTVLDVIEERRPNVFVGVPTMYADLETAGAADRDLSSIQLWASSADVMPEERARRFQRYGAAATVAGRPVGTAAFADLFGMVELSGPAALRVYPPSPVGPVPVPPVNIVLPGIEVRAVDEDGRDLGWGEVGVLQFRGPNVLQGYAGDHDDAGPDPEGWFGSGDLGRVWPGGMFTFAGRGHDRLKVGGFSVFPAEVESELRDHPDVRDVAVVGLPDERQGEVPVALVVPEVDSFEDGPFLEWAQKRVAGYRRPRRVFVVDGLPRANHGKVDRAATTRIAEERASEAGGE